MLKDWAKEISRFLTILFIFELWISHIIIIIIIIIIAR